MPRVTKQCNSVRRGFSLVELTLASSLVAMLGMAITGMIYSSYGDFVRSTTRSNLQQEGRAALVRITRELRQSQSFVQVSAPQDDAGMIQYIALDGTPWTVYRNGDSLYMGPIATPWEIAYGLTHLSLTCYDYKNSVLADPVCVSKIKSIEIQAIFEETGNESVRFQLTNRICWPKSPNGIVINEIMYDPIGVSNESENEWIELYNATPNAIDLTGWKIWSTTASYTDPLISHPVYGNGTCLLPGNGYAVISTLNTKVYTDCIAGGQCESPGLSQWTQTGTWTLSSAAYTGTYAAAFSEHGTGTLTQDITIPAGGRSALFTFWEKTQANPTNTLLVVSIKDSSNQDLVICTHGQMHSEWTRHTVDLAPYAGQALRVFVSITQTGWQTCLIDNLSLARSQVDAQALRLCVDDPTSDTIGHGLGNSGDTVTLTSETLVDSVSYSSDWGPVTSGHTLARIDPNAPSNDETNWENGPDQGTPGRDN